ncbi:guanylate-binding protein 1-like isoform X1 [Larus michahellis]
MASEIHVPEPVCLIENTRTKGLVVQQEALQVLSGITQPVVVVAITGLYRTGKSYLMNRLACQRKGFSLGSGVQSHTRGIWMWCVPHPCKPGHTLVLLDTEGLGDVEKGDMKNDMWIFVLTMLLSSTLIYNSKGTIDQQAVDQLHYVMKLTEQVKLKAAPEQSEDELEDSENVAPIFPTFVWTVRDFTLQLEVDGKEISEDEYLENALKLKAGSSPETQRYNQPRECICQFFRDRKCFVFYQPAHRRDLVRLEELQDDEIDCEFRQQVEKFCSHIWEKSPPKTIPCGRTITGTLLGKLAESYVETIWSGAVPCLESAVLALAKTVNAAAVKEAVTLYQDLMEWRVKLPTETVQELLDLHTQCERETLELFQKQAFEEEICSFLADLTVGGPQPSQDSPRDATIPLALGKWHGPGGRGSPASCQRTLLCPLQSRLGPKARPDVLQAVSCPAAPPLLPRFKSRAAKGTRLSPARWRISLRSGGRSTRRPANVNRRKRAAVPVVASVVKEAPLDRVRDPLVVKEAPLDRVRDPLVV